MFERPLIRRPSAATFSRKGRRIRRVKILPLKGEVARRAGGGRRSRVLNKAKK
jgi:hypothetical protein